MRIIITGGTGQIGRALAKHFVAEGHEVIALSRSPSLAQGLPPQVKIEGWDARTARGWGHLVNGADAIINLAGANLSGSHFFPAHWTDERKKVLVESRINAGKAVVEAVEQADEPPRLLVQASASGYYGEHPHSVQLTEEDPAGDNWLGQLCQQWEDSSKAVEDKGVRRVITRSGVVLSFVEPGGALYRMALPFRFFVGGPFGSGQQPFPWIHPSDEVGAMAFLIKHPDAMGPFNLTAPITPTNKQFAQALGRVMNRPSLIPVPGIAFKLAFGEVSSIILEGQNVLPARLQELGYEFMFPDAESALRDLYQKEIQNRQ